MNLQNENSLSISNHHDILKSNISVKLCRLPNTSSSSVSSIDSYETAPDYMELPVRLNLTRDYTPKPSQAQLDNMTNKLGNNFKIHHNQHPQLTNPSQSCLPFEGDTSQQDQRDDHQLNRDLKRESPPEIKSKYYKSQAPSKRQHHSTQNKNTEKLSNSKISNCSDKSTVNHRMHESTSKCQNQSSAATNLEKDISLKLVINKNNNSSGRIQNKSNWKHNIKFKISNYLKQWDNQSKVNLLKIYEAHLSTDNHKMCEDDGMVFTLLVFILCICLKISFEIINLLSSLVDRFISAKMARFIQNSLELWVKLADYILSKVLFADQEMCIQEYTHNIEHESNERSTTILDKLPQKYSSRKYGEVKVVENKHGDNKQINKQSQQQFEKNENEADDCLKSLNSNISDYAENDYNEIAFTKIFDEPTKTDARRPECFDMFNSEIVYIKSPSSSPSIDSLSATDLNSINTNSTSIFSSPLLVQKPHKEDSVSRGIIQTGNNDREPNSKTVSNITSGHQCDSLLTKVETPLSPSRAFNEEKSVCTADITMNLESNETINNNNETAGPVSSIYENITQTESGTNKPSSSSFCTTEKANAFNITIPRNPKQFEISETINFSSPFLSRESTAKCLEPSSNMLQFENSNNSLDYIINAGSDTDNGGESVNGMIVDQSISPIRNLEAATQDPLHTSSAKLSHDNSNNICPSSFVSNEDSLNFKQEGTTTTNNLIKSFTFPSYYHSSSSSFTNSPTTPTKTPSEAMLNISTPPSFGPSFEHCRVVSPGSFKMTPRSEGSHKRNVSLSILDRQKQLFSNYNRSSSSSPSSQISKKLYNGHDSPSRKYTSNFTTNKTENGYNTESDVENQYSSKLEQRGKNMKSKSISNRSTSFSAGKIFSPTPLSVTDKVNREHHPHPAKTNKPNRRHSLSINDLWAFSQLSQFNNFSPIPVTGSNNNNNSSPKKPVLKHTRAASASSPSSRSATPKLPGLIDFQDPYWVSRSAANSPFSRSKSMTISNFRTKYGSREHSLKLSKDSISSHNGEEVILNDEQFTGNSKTTGNKNNNNNKKRPYSSSLSNYKVSLQGGHFADERVDEMPRSKESSRKESWLHGTFDQQHQQIPRTSSSCSIFEPESEANFADFSFCSLDDEVIQICESEDGQSLGNDELRQRSEMLLSFFNDSSNDLLEESETPKDKEEFHPKIDEAKLRELNSKILSPPEPSLNLSNDYFSSKQNCLDFEDEDLSINSILEGYCSPSLSSSAKENESLRRSLSLGSNNSSNNCKPLKYFLVNGKSEEDHGSNNNMEEIKSDHDGKTSTMQVDTKIHPQDPKARPSSSGDNNPRSTVNNRSSSSNNNNPNRNDDNNTMLMMGPPKLRHSIKKSTWSNDIKKQSRTSFPFTTKRHNNTEPFEIAEFSEPPSPLENNPLYKSRKSDPPLVSPKYSLQKRQQEEEEDNDTSDSDNNNVKMTMTRSSSMPSTVITNNPFYIQDLYHSSPVNKKKNFFSSSSSPQFNKKLTEEERKKIEKEREQLAIRNRLNLNETIHILGVKQKIPNDNDNNNNINDDNNNKN